MTVFVRLLPIPDFQPNHRTSKTCRTPPNGFGFEKQNLLITRRLPGLYYLCRSHNVWRLDVPTAVAGRPGVVLGAGSLRLEVAEGGREWRSEGLDTRHTRIWPCATI